MSASNAWATSISAPMASGAIWTRSSGSRYSASSLPWATWTSTTKPMAPSSSPTPAGQFCGVRHSCCCDATRKSDWPGVSRLPAHRWPTRRITSYGKRCAACASSWPKLRVSRPMSFFRMPSCWTWCSDGQTAWPSWAGFRASAKRSWSATAATFSRSFSGIAEPHRRQNPRSATPSWKVPTCSGWA